MLLVLPRISPLGPFLAGLGYLAVQGYGMVANVSFVSHFADPVLGVRGALIVPVGTGLTLLLAVPLLATVLSPQRWRGRAGAVGAAGAGAAAAAPTFAPTFPGYSPGPYPPGPYPPAPYAPAASSYTPPPPLHPTAYEPVSGTPVQAEDTSVTRPLSVPPPSSGAPASYPTFGPPPPYPPPADPDSTSRL
jgi:hypothetical protein